MIISGKIDVTKILKDKMFKGKTGSVYLDISIVTNREKDQYGNDGIITQDLGKEARARKERGPILGNVRIIAGDQGFSQRKGEKSHQEEPKKQQNAPPQDDSEDSVPF